MDVSAVVTSYNTWPLTLRCVESLIRFSGTRLKDIVVVDDGSSDPSPALGAGVRVVRNAENRGYVASVNVGVAAAQGEVVVLLDSDARVLSDVVDPCVDAFTREPKLGALGFRTVSESGSETGCSDTEPDALGLLLGQRLDAVRRRHLRPPPRRKTLFFSCAIAFRRAAFASAGGFDEGFDFLDADLDFSRRLYELGWEQHQEPRLLAVHAGGGSPQTTAKRVIRFHRNRWRYLEKHGALPMRLPYKVALATRHLVEYAALRLGGSALERHALEDKLRGRRALLRSVWKGYGNE